MYLNNHVALPTLQVQQLRASPPKSIESLTAYLRSMRRLLSSREVATILGHHQETVYRLISESGLPAQKHRGRWRHDPIKLADWIEAQ